MLLLPILVLALDLHAIQAEPNLEKRSQLALEAANQSIDAARDAYNAGDDKGMRGSLDQVEQFVELSYKSLQETGKRPRKSKAYKHAEQRTAEMLRRLDGLKDTFGYDGRAALDKVARHVSDIHDKLLQAIMSKKK